MARRYSGGGATVFQDLKQFKLYVSLFMSRCMMLIKQLSVILKALAKLGIHGEKNGPQ